MRLATATRVCSLVVIESTLALTSQLVRITGGGGLGIRLGTNHVELTTVPTRDPIELIYGYIAIHLVLQDQSSSSIDIGYTVMKSRGRDLDTYINTRARRYGTFLLCLWFPRGSKSCRPRGFHCIRYLYYSQSLSLATKLCA